MTLKFYFAPYSTATVTTDVLNELEHGLDKPLAERVQVSLGKDGDVSKEPYLTEVNPNGLVPALVHDGVPIWESAAVTMYLGELFGVDRPEPLYPAMGPKRGEAMKWIVWANLHLAVMANRIHVAKADKKEDDEKRPRDSLAKSYGILDAALKGKEYLLGSYTLADTHVWSFISYLDYLDIKTDGYENITAWRGRMDARPARKCQDDA